LVNLTSAGVPIDAAARAVGLSDETIKALEDDGGDDTDDGDDPQMVAEEISAEDKTSTTARVRQAIKRSDGFDADEYFNTER